MTRTTLRIDGTSLTIEDVWRVAFLGEQVELADSARPAMQASRDVVDAWVDAGKVIYGVTTGFGDFATVKVPREMLEELQQNLILSHAAGVGEPLAPATVRAMLLLRANALARGFSGVRVSTVEHLLEMLNRNLLPVIPSQGSVGSSGDLAPLSHLALGAMGRGMLWTIPAHLDHPLSQLRTTNWEQRPAVIALEEAHMIPLRLGAKEGLALINGTQMMSAIGSLSVREAKRLAKIADVTAAMSIEALKGSDNPFDPRLHATRPMHGQQIVAANLRRMMGSSPLRESHRNGDPRVQDPYSMRCAPQVHGASRDAIAYVESVIATEINSVTDNPLIFAEDGAHIEGGNFHGQPLALALDFLAIAAAELASISERRTDRMLQGHAGLPKFLTGKGGLHSGLMIAQYTAASIVSENKVLAHPASVDSIPTSANQEDHNSMGSIAAQKCWRVIENLRHVLAIEALCAHQALGFQAERPGVGTLAAQHALDGVVAHIDADRELHVEINAVAEYLKSDALLEAVSKAVVVE